MRSLPLGKVQHLHTLHKPHAHGSDHMNAVEIIMSLPTLLAETMFRRSSFMPRVSKRPDELLVFSPLPIKPQTWLELQVHRRGMNEPGTILPTFQHLKPSYYYYCLSQVLELEVKYYYIEVEGKISDPAVCLPRTGRYPRTSTSSIQSSSAITHGSPG